MCTESTTPQPSLVNSIGLHQLLQLRDEDRRLVTLAPSSLDVYARPLFSTKGDELSAAYLVYLITEKLRARYEGALEILREENALLDEPPRLQCDDDDWDDWKDSPS